MIVGEKFPGVAVGGVILAHGTPLPIGKIRPPAIPWLAVRVSFVQSLSFCICHNVICSRFENIALLYQYSHSEKERDERKARQPDFVRRMRNRGDRNSQSSGHQSTTSSQQAAHVLPPAAAPL